MFAVYLKLVSFDFFISEASKYDLTIHHFYYQGRSVLAQVIYSNPYNNNGCWLQNHLETVSSCEAPFYNLKKKKIHPTH